MTRKLRDFISEAQRQQILGAHGLHCRPPRSVYTHPDFMQLEYEAWLDRTWMMVGRAHDLPEPGDAVPVAGQPFFLVRGRDRKIRAFHNACRHRGHELVSAPCRKKRGIVCPYHHWTYDLDGRLLATPHFAGAKVSRHPDLDYAAFGLKEVRCAQWHNWVLINVDGAAAPLEDFVRPMDDKFADVDFSRLKHYTTVSKHPMPINWKIAMENNVEPYHVPMVHTQTAAGQPLVDHRVVDDGTLVGCEIEIPEAPFTNQSGSKRNEHLDSSSRYILRVPNLYLSSHAPDKIVDSLILPDRDSPDRCWISHAIYATSDEGMTEQEAKLWHELEHEVLLEDLAVMEGVANGMRSSVPDDGGVLSPVWETCISGFHRNMLTALAREHEEGKLKAGT